MEQTENNISIHELLQEKAKNFYDYLMEIIPESDNKKKISDFETIKKNIYLLIMYIDENNIERNTNMLKSYFGLNDIHDDTKLHEYMKFFLEIKKNMYSSEID